MSATEPVDSHKKNQFLKIHESKLKSVKRFIEIGKTIQIYFAEKLVNTFYVLRVNRPIFDLIMTWQQGTD